MPIYEYKCPYCKYETEVTQKIKDPDPSCPRCLEDGNLSKAGMVVKMVKQISLGGFTLKGGGWYKDGYSSRKK